MKNKIYILLATFLLSCSLYAHAQIITTVAGCDTAYYSGDGGPATSARLISPIDIAFDAAGNMYISDRDHDLVRKVCAATGIITSIAGNQVPGYSGNNGPATDAEINGPYGIVVDAIGNIYFADDYNDCLRKIDTAGIITTIAGTQGIPGFSGDSGPATAAQIDGPALLAFDEVGSLYFADGQNNRVRKIDTAGIINTVAGSSSIILGDNGPATAAFLNGPYGITFDAAGNMYIGELSGNRVRKINASGIITTVAGTGVSGFSGDNGPATAAEFHGPVDVVFDAVGNLYISDAYNNCIRKVDSGGIVSTIVGIEEAGYSGDNGPADSAKLNEPDGIRVDVGGDIYFADFGNNRIRRISSTLGVKNITANQSSISVYPNPCHDEATIEVNSAVNEPVSFVVTNALGQKVFEIAAITNTPAKWNITQPSGIYFVSAYTSSGVSNTKIIAIQ